MPYGPDGANPRKMQTHCANVDVENQNTVRTGHTSDPLLKVVESIAWLTEVSYFHVKDVIDTSFFSQIVPILIGYMLVVLFILVLLLLVQSLLKFHGFQSFALHRIGLSFPGGVMAWWYLHFLWVKPSRHLLLGVQQVRKVSQKEGFLVVLYY